MGGECQIPVATSKKGPTGVDWVIEKGKPRKEPRTARSKNKNVLFNMHNCKVGGENVGKKKEKVPRGKKETGRGFHETEGPNGGTGREGLRKGYQRAGLVKKWATRE